MDTFITSLVIYVGLLSALATPLWVVTWRKDRLESARNFLIVAIVIGICAATLETVSERQVLQCLEAGNSDCFDSGTSGLQLLAVVLYTGVAWFNAYLMWRD